MASELTLPKQPIAIRPEHIASGITTLRFQSTSWIGGEYAVSTFASDSQGSAMDAELTKLFVIDGNPASWSQHRYFRDASGLPLFELRRKPTGVTWLSRCRVVALHRWRRLRRDGAVSRIDAMCLLPMQRRRERRPCWKCAGETWKRWTHIYCNGALAMQVKLANMMSVYSRETASMAGGGCRNNGSTLASVIAVFLAENLYQFSLQSSHSANEQMLAPRLE